MEADLAYSRIDHGVVAEERRDMEKWGGMGEMELNQIQFPPPISSRGEN